jgi:hypothetical protein
MIEFEHYLKKGESISPLTKRWSEFNTNKYDYLKELSNEDFRKVDHNQCLKEIKEVHLKELQKILNAISKAMKIRLEELENKIK